MVAPIKVMSETEQNHYKQTAQENSSSNSTAQRKLIVEAQNLNNCLDELFQVYSCPATNSAPSGNFFWSDLISWPKTSTNFNQYVPQFILQYFF